MSFSIGESAFEHQVLEASVPVLVHFWAPWCGLCKMITPLLSRFQAEWSGQVKLVDINADENLHLANRYRLSTLPTLLMVNQGNVIHRMESLRSKEELRATLDTLMRSQLLQHPAMTTLPIRPYKEAPGTLRSFLS